MIAVSAVSPGKLQHRTGTPSRVTAIAITTCGRSGPVVLGVPKAAGVGLGRAGVLVVAGAGCPCAFAWPDTECKSKKSTQVGQPRHWAACDLQPFGGR